MAALLKPFTCRIHGKKLHLVSKYNHQNTLTKTASVSCHTIKYIHFADGIKRIINQDEAQDMDDDFDTERKREENELEAARRLIVDRSYQRPCQNEVQYKYDSPDSSDTE